MPRPAVRLALLVLAAFAAAAPAPGAAGDVYKWTDAEGVTHYGDAPPADGEFEHRRVDDRSPAPPAATGDGRTGDGRTDAAPAGGEDPQCAEVRRHLALLGGDAPVQQDTDGDGEADRILSQADREAQARLAEKMLAANCATPTTGT